MIVIRLQPECGTLRSVLAIIRASRTDSVAIKSPETGWTRPLFLDLPETLFPGPFHKEDGQMILNERRRRVD